MYVVHTVPIIIDAIARNLSGVRPDVGCQVWVGVIDARINHADDNLAGALCVSPGRFCKGGGRIGRVQGELWHPILVGQKGVIGRPAGIEVESIELVVNLS